MQTKAKKLIFLVCGLILSTAIGGKLTCAQAMDSVELELRKRHASAPYESLVEMAGSREALKEQLLLLRNDASMPPYVAVRVQKILLSNYAEDTDVIELFVQDLQAPSRMGLARVITLHLDAIPSKDTRSRLAKVALDRAESDEAFRSVARHLRESADADIQREARQRVSE